MREFKAKQGELLKTNLEATESKQRFSKPVSYFRHRRKKGFCRPEQAKTLLIRRKKN
jgi:hypothetical protein